MNSLCHKIGKRRFETDDTSTNVWWLTVYTFGQSLHNNHHAFPHVALLDFQGDFDPSAHVIRLMERLGWITNVRRVAPGRLESKLKENAKETTPL